MHFNEAFDNRQSDAKPTVRLAARMRKLRKQIEQPDLILNQYSQPIVRNFD